MKFCKKSDIKKLIENKRLKIVSPHKTIMLDNYRIGLSLKYMCYSYEKELDCSMVDNYDFIPDKKIDLRKQKVIKHGTNVIGESQEKIMLDYGLFGLMFTRSKYARIGFELFKSSSYISPGTGYLEPTPIVFEMSFKYSLANFYNNDNRYGFILIFDSGEVDSSFFDHKNYNARLINLK